MRRRALLLFLVLAGSISPVRAQTQPTPPPRSVVPVFIPQRADPSADLPKARQLEQAGQVEAAITLYERILTVSPAHPEALSALQRLYLRVRRYDKAIALLNRQVERDPKNLVYRRMLADALFRSERTDEGRAQGQAMLEIDPRGEGTYRLVATLYAEHGLFDEAAETYRRGRSVSKQPAAFALELAGLYTALSDIRNAVGEYLLWLKAQPAQFAMIDDQIEGLADQKGVEAVELALKEAAATPPPRVEVFKLLGNFYIRRGQPGQAFEQYQQAESLTGGKGIYLLEFATWCEREQFFEDAIRAYQSVQNGALPLVLLARASLGLARSLVALGRVDEALTVYRQVVERAPRTRESEEATFQIAELQLTKQYDPKTALNTYRSLLASAPKTPRREDCLFRLADCQVASGSLQDAIAQYKAILNPKESGLPDFGDRAKEHASFGLAELALFQGRFDDAAAQFQDVAQRFPGGVYANDALHWSLLIDETREAGDDILRVYVQARLLARQYRPNEALDQYKLFLNAHPATPVSDAAILEIGALLTGMEKPLEAIAAYRDLIERYPISRHAAEAQRRIAEVYETRLHDIPQAIAAYETILTKYPDSLFYDAVRRKLRGLTSRHLPRP
ncbi:MAG: tetratricopeptide repeat protein [Candidatus Latescibacteria bacterium]|nr:tetratricopeptide repeat protein [Candidatus Latescibacterota bacterium]